MHTLYTALLGPPNSIAAKMKSKRREVTGHDQVKDGRTRAATSGAGFAGS